MSDPGPEPMRILEIETFGRGGLTHYVFNLSLALAERGHQITMVTAAAFELEGRAVPPNVRVVKSLGRATVRFEDSLPSFALGFLRKVEAVFDSFAAVALARRMRPDVVHFHCTNRIALLFLRGLARLNRPLVVTAHVVTPHEPIRFQQAVYGRIHRLGDLIVVHSEFDMKRLLEEFGVDPKRVAVIPLGGYGFFERGGELVDREEARQSLGIGSQEVAALFFGYIREYKGLDILLDAWASVAEARPEARLVVAGDPVQLGSKRLEELERWAERLGAVHHFGYVPLADVTRYFVASDVLVMPYRHISQSGVLYLALSLGVPVVASRVGALSEMLRDGESALLVPPESPQDLARALIRLLGDAGLRETLARGGRRIAEEHSWPSIAERTERVFAPLVERYRGTLTP